MADKPQPRVIITDSEDQSRGYRITLWHQYRNYECMYCQYATLWLKKMEVHLADGEHPWAYPGQYDEPKDEGIIDTSDPPYS